MAHHFTSAFPLLQTTADDPTLEFITHFTNLNPISYNTAFSFLNDDHFPRESHHSSSSHQPLFLSKETTHTPSDIRRAEDVTDSSSINLSPPQSQTVKLSTPTRKNNCGKRKREMEDKGKEVVHVRARRGQATDSHSIAERIRREKINERLRCLQDIVPGCYKSMGMAVMLDEIINYVHSLQNQVEFLSMKLAAASALQDLNAERDAIATIQLFTNTAKTYEVQEVERSLLGFDQLEALAHFQSTWSL